MTTATRISEIFGSPTQAPITPKISRQYITSGMFTAPANGWVMTMQMGGGGGGGRINAAGTATGGSSAAWAGKLWRVSAGQTLTITIGAGGIAAASDGAAGGDGGATTITDGVVTVTSPGGRGGLASATPVALTGPSGGAAPTNADMGAAGSKAGDCAATANSRTGGAGVDILAKGGNATRSGNADGGKGSGGGSVAWPSADASSVSTAGAGYGGPSVGSTAGPNIAGTLAAADLYGFAKPSEWGTPYFGHGGATANNGGGGSSSGTGGNGGFGGGGGAAGGGTSGTGGNGGFGGGGGAGGSSAGVGGSGYVWLEFVSEGAV